MPRLLLAEQVARPSNFQIRRGDAEPGSQFGELLDGGQPLLGVIGQRALVRHEKIGVGLLAASSDPST